jgi:ribosome-associated protein
VIQDQQGHPTSEAEDEVEETEGLEWPDPETEPSDGEDEEFEADDASNAEPVATSRVDDGLTSEDKVRLMAAAADAVRAEEIVVLDLRELTIIADFFLVCTGKSSIQIRAIADRIEERLRDHGLRKLRIEGYQEATWILLDYGDTVAHVMAAEQRAFYDLEAFWSAAPQLVLDLKAEPIGLAGSATRFDSLTPPVLTPESE